MFEQDQDPASLRPQELEAIYAISRAVARAVDTEPILDEIIRLVRSVFIFDNMVVYVVRQNKTLEPTYARAIGRGRFREAELAWGESIAHEAFQSRQTIIRQETAPQSRRDDEDRTSLRYFLGLPLNLGEEAVGALVFIRFGGPIYSPDHIHLAEFIATHVAQLLGRRLLVERVANLEAQRKLDNLQDGFIAMISHELLTPLGFIKGYATTLLREDTNWDDTTRREFLTIIDEESDRLRELIDNLMDSSRLQAGTLRMTFQPVRLDTFLRDIALRAKTRAEPINVHLELQETGLQIQADPTRLAQIFDNLLGNAAKYAPGSLIDLILDTKDEMVRIQVRDHGPGIEQEHIEHLFKRFYRVPGKSTSLRGTGLGLFICRQITQAHHGEINVNSKIGEGTTFTILLPTNDNHAYDNHAYDNHAYDNHSEGTSALKEAQI
jgi:signal transduction histidine kinase